MKECKKNVVLLFLLILYLVPQGILWHPTSQHFCLVGVPFYLFQNNLQVICEYCGESYVYSGLGMVWERVPHMVIIAYVCFGVTLCLFLESVYAGLRRKQPLAVRRGTAGVLVCLNIIQFVCASVYYYDIEAMPGETKWMNELAFIHMVAAIALWRSFKQQKEFGIRKKVWFHLLYLCMVCYGIVGQCFVRLHNVNKDNADVDYTRYSLSFLKVPQWDSGWSDWDREHWIVVGVLVVALVSVLVVGVIMMFLKEEKRISCMEALNTITQIAALLLLIWIMAVCLFSELMKSKVGFMRPDILTTILISWSCWRLAGAGSKGYDRKHVEL